MKKIISSSDRILVFEKETNVKTELSEFNGDSGPTLSTTEYSNLAIQAFWYSSSMLSKWGYHFRNGRKNLRWVKVDLRRLLSKGQKTRFNHKNQKIGRIWQRENPLPLRQCMLDQLHHFHGKIFHKLIWIATGYTIFARFNTQELFPISKYETTARRKINWLKRALILKG